MVGQAERLKEIADAIRNKKGTTDLIKASDFAREIESIETSSGGYNIESIVIEDGTQILKITDPDYVEPTGYDEVFGNNSPAELSRASLEIANKGLTAGEVESIYGWKLGDKKEIELITGEVIQVMLIGVNHDDLSDETGKVGLTLMMAGALETNYTFNDTATNDGGYPASKIRNETLPTLKALLPDEWQDIIRSVNKKSANGGYNNYTETVTTAEDLFLLSLVELDGNTESYARDQENEGTKYEYWDERGVVPIGYRSLTRSCSSGYSNCEIQVGFSSTENPKVCEITVREIGNAQQIAFAFCI